MLRRGWQAVAVVILAVVMLGADDSESRFNRIGHRMMCVCSCGQVLLECNHVGCPDSARMIGELRAQLGAGADGGGGGGGVGDSSVMNWFVNKYGATVLAAPMRGGFDNVAWVAPLLVFAMATLGTAVLVKVWKRRTDRMMLAGALAEPERGRATVVQRDLRERIRRDTERPWD